MRVGGGGGLREQLLDDRGDGVAAGDQEHALLEGVELQLRAQPLEPRRAQLAWLG